MFDMRIPKEFKKNYLTQQNAMKIASSYLFTNIAVKHAQNALISIIVKETNRSLSDCTSLVKGIPEANFNNFIKLARKFVR